MVTTPASYAWDTERGRLTGIAYRLLGDFGLAEDVVSEVAIEALRQERKASEPVRSWPALLTTICVRRSIDRARELARTREEYVGHWLPEPVATARLPEDAVADREMLSIALLHLAEQLTPEARAAVVLHRAFGMTAIEIGEILEKTAVAVRQLISRAERRLQVDTSLEAPRSLSPEVLEHLLRAIGGGDVSAVVELLAPEAILWADGGGRVRSALNPVFGAERIARFFTGILQKSADSPPGTRSGGWLIEINGEPAIALRLAERIDVLTFEVGTDGLIRGLRQIANPEKLHHAFLQ
ncbi:sigma-70 family RNA polymerase sigma factor [Psychromicrobium lacuslunae]|uniref:Sigma-70 family RNA polymerase sigma factor n=1 Tax=Psychromicrobium lacuslunae TaxID=1618207 RepID=A0A0D4BVM0_9MICC|nr:sigma-70 family RNA polymerase sigma factor [Psychromicrobium lacuslunae]AJT40358.1 sigma-70 family RNA polymerase sigma factor [Psychromicrobium lacuslunae]